MALLKFSLKTNIIKSIYSEIFSKISSYYYAYGKTSAWPTITNPTSGSLISGEDSPPVPIDSYSDEAETRRNIVYVKHIDSNDTSIVIRRINWVIGTTYDMYDEYSANHIAASGAESLNDANYYVLTSDYNVYKCLYSSGPSLIQPIGTSLEQFNTSDGYVWKFLYTIPLYLRQKFLTSVWMPVTTALSNQFYSSGGIVDYSIEDSGSGYTKTTWKVKNIRVLNGGSQYASGDLITFIAPTSGTTALATIVVDDALVGNVASVTLTEPGTGYVTQPTIASITTTSGAGFQYTIEYERENAAINSEWTEIVISGDGFNEQNPYSIKATHILPTVGHAGVYASPITGDVFVWPTPEKAYGRKPIVTPVYKVIGGGNANYEIDYINVIDPGYGYTVPLEFGINVATPGLAGFLCDLGSRAEQKNEADLVPLVGDDGTIQGITINDNGIGYTYASVDAKLYKRTIGGVVEIDEGATSGPTYKSDFRKARFGVNFSIGDIETKQSTVELLAVNGSIPIVVVENGGIGYQSSDVLTLIGDGVGFAGTPILGSSGTITGINITNQGSAYTYATITIGANTSATLRPIISPHGGHGKDAVSELGAHTIMLTGRLGLEKIHQIDFNDPLDQVYYRQISLLKNPYKYNSKLLYRNASGSTTILFGSVKVGNTSYSALKNGMVLTATISGVDKTYTVIGKTSVLPDKYYIAATINDNYIPPSGSYLSFVDENQAILNFTASSITLPEIDKFTGELLYIDNRTKFVPSEQQTIITSTLIAF